MEVANSHQRDGHITRSPRWVTVHIFNHAEAELWSPSSSHFSPADSARYISTDFTIFPFTTLSVPLTRPFITYIFSSSCLLFAVNLTRGRTDPALAIIVVSKRCVLVMFHVDDVQYAMCNAMCAEYRALDSL